MALAHYRDQGQAHGLSGHVDYAGDAVGDGVGSHGIGVPKLVMRPQHHQLAGLEEAVFQAVGDTDGEDAPNRGQMHAYTQQVVQLKRTARVAQEDQNDDRPPWSGDQSADARPQGPHVKAVDQDGVHGDVYDVDHQGIEHGDLAVAMERKRAAPAL